MHPWTQHRAKLLWKLSTFNSTSDERLASFGRRYQNGWEGVLELMISIVKVFEQHVLLVCSKGELREQNV